MAMESGVEKSVTPFVHGEERPRSHARTNSNSVSRRHHLSVVIEEASFLLRHPFGGHYTRRYWWALGLWRPYQCLRIEILASLT